MSLGIPSCQEGSGTLFGLVQLHVDVHIFGWACHTKRGSANIELREYLLLAVA